MNFEYKSSIRGIISHSFEKDSKVYRESLFNICFPTSMNNRCTSRLLCEICTNAPLFIFLTYSLTSFVSAWSSNSRKQKCCISSTVKRQGTQRQDAEIPCKNVDMLLLSGLLQLYDINARKHLPIFDDLASTLRTPCTDSYKGLNNKCIASCNTTILFS